jgi:hypothetical protein
VRSIEILVFSATCEDIAAELEANGFERLPAQASRWNYPPGPSAVLYVSCDAYRRDVELPEEHAEVLAATGGRVPTTSISADVSGQSPGDAEVLRLVDCVLSKYDGVAFDDYISLAHGWTLDEIQSRAEVDGLRFFDYLGHQRGPGVAPR